MRACNYGPEGNLAVPGLALLTFYFLFFKEVSLCKNFQSTGTY